MGLNQRGFTFVELMIVVVVIGVLAAIAIPNYQSRVADSKRKAAQTALLDLASAMEKHKLRTGTYVGAADGNDRPSIFATQVPLQGGTAVYNLEIHDITITTYTLYAKPVNSGPQANNGGLSVDHAGQRKWERNGTGTGYLSGWD